MSTPINSYVTPAEFLQWVTPTDTSVDVVDDAVIASILESVARYIDGQTNRKFYPTVETQTYDVPGGRSLVMDDDLLEVISVTNGDGSAITSTYYNLYPPNTYPKDEIRLTETSGLFWTNSSTSYEQVIDIAAIFGYRERYTQEGWKLVTTLNEAVDASETDIDVVAGGYLPTGTIWRVGNEILITKSVSTNTVMVLSRGDNGSTAATHDTGTSVYLWAPQHDIALAFKQIAQNVYRRFAGSNAAADENIVTASGIVITPRDVPVIASRTLARYKRIY